MPDRESIWFVIPTKEDANARGGNTMVSHLGIRITEVGADYMKATMPVDDTTRQPHGILHGGASLALAETVGSTAANWCVDHSRFFCVGVEINGNHVRAVRDGTVTATARPLHLGRSTQVWEIRILDAEEHLVCVSRLTMAVMSRK